MNVVFYCSGVFHDAKLRAIGRVRNTLDSVFSHRRTLPSSLFSGIFSFAKYGYFRASG